MKNRKAQGFTLIELLIVIAIIGILAAVLIPNLLGARARSFDAAAQSCAKAIATYEETKMIDTNDYAHNAAVGADSGLNVCAQIAITINSDSTDPAYSYDVQHPNGARAFNVTPNGIVPATRVQ